MPILAVARDMHAAQKRRAYGGWLYQAIQRKISRRALSQHTPRLPMNPRIRSLLTAVLGASRLDVYSDRSGQRVAHQFAPRVPGDVETTSREILPGPRPYLPRPGS